MKKILFSILLPVFYCGAIDAQSVGIGTNAPKASALLDVTSSNKGVLLPRLTTAQRKAIVNPERALLVFDTDKGAFMLYDGGSWKILALTDEDKTSLINRTATSPQAEERFGQTADISGNYAIIGAPFYRSPTLGNKIGEAFIFFKDATGWKRQARLAAPDSASFDFFGSAVAIYGDYCVVGVSQKLVGANYSQGKVYVYKRNGTAWNLEAGLTASDGATSDYFGYSVDITINSANLPVLAVGAPGAAVKGQVYTYTRNNATNTWNYLQTLSPADLVNGNQFGLSVSMHQDYLAVGAPYQDNTPYNLTISGAAYIYVFGGGVFTQQQKVPGSYSNAQFGFSLSLYGNKLVISAPWQSAYGYSTGSAYVVVLKRTGANWDYTYTNFVIPESEGGSINMRYGQSLSINDNQLLIGAPSGIIFPQGSGIGGGLPGAAYLYASTDDGATYYLKEKITSTNSFTGDLFSHAVAIEPDGNYIIGIPYQNVTTAGGIQANAGGVYFGFYTP
jgi:hypothetical protein